MLDVTYPSSQTTSTATVRPEADSPAMIRDARLSYTSARLSRPGLAGQVATRERGLGGFKGKSHPLGWEQADVDE